MLSGTFRDSRLSREERTFVVHGQSGLDSSLPTLIPWLRKDGDVLSFASRKWSWRSDANPLRPWGGRRGLCACQEPRAFGQVDIEQVR